VNPVDFPKAMLSMAQNRALPEVLRSIVTSIAAWRNSPRPLPIAGVLINGKTFLRWLSRVKEQSVEIHEAREIPGVDVSLFRIPPGSKAPTPVS
jgi:hypothetical protein